MFTPLFLTLLLQFMVISLIIMYDMPKRKNFILILAGGLVIGGTVCSFFPTFDLGGWEPGYLIAFVTVCLIALSCFSARPSRTLFIMIIVYAIENCSYHLFTALNIFLNIPSTNPLFFVYNYLFSIVITLIFELSYFRHMKKSEDIELGRAAQSVFSAVVLLIVFLLSGAIKDAYFEPFGIFVCHIFGLLGCVLALVILLGLFAQSELREKNKATEQLLHKTQEQYGILKNNIETINIKYHDLKHMLSLIYNMENISEQRKGIEKVRNEIMPYSSVVATDCEALNVVLMEKSLLCQRENIQLFYIVDGEKLDFIDQLDLFVLFGNMLDNAIEAVKKLEDTDKRTIHINITAKGQLLYITEENYFSGQLEWEGELPKTSKLDTRYHGFGMRSIQILVQKYAGGMTVSSEEDIFRLNIVIPIPEKI